jgi:hypothetical protein
MELAASLRLRRRLVCVGEDGSLTVLQKKSGVSENLGAGVAVERLYHDIFVHAFACAALVLQLCTVQCRLVKGTFQCVLGNIVAVTIQLDRVNSVLKRTPGTNSLCNLSKSLKDFCTVNSINHPCMLSACLMCFY